MAVETTTLGPTVVEEDLGFSVAASGVSRCIHLTLTSVERCCMLDLFPSKKWPRIIMVKYVMFLEAERKAC